MYSAVGFDTVGPALYNPNLDANKKVARIGDFHTSKANRRVFEPTVEITNNLPPKENPGPAHYDSVGKVLSKQFNA